MLQRLGIIPDGNRRWGNEHMLSAATQGHSRGRETAQKIIEAAFAEGVTDVVFLGATDLNLRNRPRGEVEHLYRLLKDELRARLVGGERGTRLYVRGDWTKFRPDAELAELIRTAEEVTARDAVRSLTILFGHNGLEDVISATTRAVHAGEPVDRESIRPFLPTSHLGEIDLIIRTGVENKDYHLSGSLLPYHTQKAYLYFTETLWPDFTPEELRKACAHYRSLPKRGGA